jgi:hypothetical protein
MIVLALTISICFLQQRDCCCSGWGVCSFHPSANVAVSDLYLATGDTMGPTIVLNGGFELGWSEPWKTVQAGSGGLPGWRVILGNIGMSCIPVIFTFRVPT